MARNLEWFEDESFWDHFAPIMFDEARWAEVPAVVDGLELLASPNQDTQSDAREPLRVLDLCCGLGRISVELALRGYSCTGVDITASYLEAAKESARDEELTIDFIQQDIRRFIRPQSFDLAVNLYTSFGYFNNPSDDALVCRNAHASVVPGGAFVIEMLGKEIAVRDFTEGESFEREGYTVLTEYSSVDSWSGLKNRWIVEKGAERYEKTFVQRLYSASELRSLLLESGFAEVDLYGDWKGQSYDNAACVLIAVARR